MTNILTSIIEHKKQEVQCLKKNIGNNFEQSLMTLVNKKTPYKFKKALQANQQSVIAEIKRRSPSKGSIGDIKDVTGLAQQYYLGGAAAISVLTDQSFFGGSIMDLQQVSVFLQDTHCAVLRKDFIIDVMQLIEARLAGADAVLLIASVLQDQLAFFIEMARRCELDALVEVHNHTEMQLAIKSGADIIGINNRNLTNFDVNPANAIELLQSMPSHVIKVSESGIETPQAAQHYFKAGFNAVLIGEALVKSKDPVEFIRKITDVERSLDECEARIQQCESNLPCNTEK